MSRRAGVTLIELLIAMTLVSLLAGGMVISLRVGMNAMDKSDDNLMGNRRAASAERILEAQVGGIMPIKALCRASGDNPANLMAFFQGETQVMRFVSSYSLQQGERGTPMILEFTVIAGDEGKGVRLVVNEHPYTGPYATGAFCTGVTHDETGSPYPQFVPVEAGPGSFVLADKLAYCRFSFRILLPGDPPVATWLPLWTRPLLPNAIRIEMAPLQADSARVQPITLTIPVHITKDPMKTDYVY